jgi:Dyp-type peroxidase family
VSRRRSLELDDIQGLVARGYGALPFASFVLLGTADAAAARRTLRGWVPSVTTARARPPGEAVNIALTAPGLAALAPGAAAAAGFSEQFTSGMATAYRSRLLGDTDDDDPRGWAWGGPGTQPVHVLVLLYADSADRLAALHGRLVEEAGDGGLLVVESLGTRTLGRDEAFGFHDGISQPRIEGLGRSGPGGEVKAGEFVLGYPNEYGQLTDRPLLPERSDPSGVLSRHDGRADLGRNGSYLVLRTLRQDIEAFVAFTEAATRRDSGQADLAARARLAAKMVGRWPSGAPLVLAPTEDDPGLGDANEFGYHVPDPRGLACPVGSHVRRTNPRDSLDPRPGTDASLAINRRHRLLRRGRSYGEAGEERGVQFICLGANLARQYEFVQHTWVNNPAFNGLEGESDPLVGARHDKNSYFTVPDRPVRRRYAELPQFVHVRGGAYFFLPGVRALRFITSEPTG